MRRATAHNEAIDLLKTYFSKIQIADKDRDLDREPLTDTNWDGDSYTTGTGIIDWVVGFGLPEIPKLVWLAIDVRDSGSTGGTYHIQLKAKSTTTNPSITAQAERAVNDALRTTHGCVAVADNGTTFYSIVSSGANTMDVWIKVVAWVK